MCYLFFEHKGETARHAAAGAPSPPPSNIEPLINTAEIMAPRLGTKLNCINAELALIGFRPDQVASFPSAAPLSLPVQFNSGDGRRVFAGAGNDHLQPEVTLNNGR